MIFLNIISFKSLYIQNVTSSPCASEWEECVGEDEMFLETTTFYDDCDIASSADALENGILEKLHKTFFLQILWLLFLLG